MPRHCSRLSYLSMCMLWSSVFLLETTSWARAATGLPELRVNSGARGTALGDAMVAVEDPDGASANPAAMISPHGGAVGFSQTAWIEDQQFSQLTVTGRRGRTVWGLNAQLSQIDGLEERVGPSTEPLGEFGVYDAALTLSLARTWRPRLRLGGSARLLRQSISTASATGAAADLGILYELTPRVQAGLSVRHVGATSHLRREATDLPTTLRLGLSYQDENRFTVSVEMQRPRDGDATLHVGGEYLVTPALALRAGYLTADSRNFTAGVGVVYGAWSLDYAYVPFTCGLSDAHRLTIRLHR